MNNKTAFHWIKADTPRKCVLIMGILAFLIIPLVVSGETAGTMAITGNVMHFPLARFTANITAGPAPLGVQFTDQSGNDPSDWIWDFGDGTGATDRNPTHTFAIGTYTVNLTVSNEAGSSTIVTKNYITGLQALAGSSQSPAPPASGSSGSGGGGGSGSSGPSAGLQRSGQLAPPEASAETPVNGLGTLTSTPLTADLNDMPGVTVSWTTLINDRPAPDARITTVIRQNADQSTLNAFTTAFHLAGLEISRVAYVMIIQKTGTTSAGPATITMTAPRDWVTRNGGIDAIQIVRMDDDGTTESLVTSFAGYDRNNGYLTFTAPSPHGLSTFGLVATKPYTPAETPAAPASGQMAPVPDPGAPATTNEASASVPLMIAVGSIFAVLAITGAALLTSIRRKT
ncbi:MAG: PKD domain-containing protein [Methanoregula sp.]